jgi:hypothetical protein
MVISRDEGDRQQRDTDVADGPQQPVQRGLVGDRPVDTVVPSARRVRVMPSRRAAQRGARCPATRISYRAVSLMGRTVGTDVVSAHHHVW